MTISLEAKNAIRYAVYDAMQYWPNAHLGDYSRRQDMRSAFKMIRSYAEHRNDLWQGIYALDRNAKAHMDM